MKPMRNSILLDWKFEAEDLFYSLKKEYRELSFLFSGEAEQIYEELLFQNPEIVLEKFGSFVSQHGYFLCDVSDGGDLYNIHLIKEKEYPAFEKKNTDDETRVIKFFSNQKAKTLKKPKSKNVKLIVDSFLMEQGERVDIEDTSLEILLPDGHSQRRPVCFSVWPPKILQASEVLETFYKYHHFFQNTHIAYAAATKGTQYYKVDLDQNPLEPIWYPKNKTFKISIAKTFDNVLFIFEYDEGVARITRVIDENVCEQIFEAPSRSGFFSFIPLSQDEFAVSLDRKTLYTKSKNYTLPNTDDFSCIFSPNSKTICYFSQTNRSAPDPSLDSERVLVLNEFNLETSENISTSLDGFCSVQEIKIDDMKQVTYRSFSGTVSASKGHADWWIFNYTTNSFGTCDWAWLWNSVTKETLSVPGEFFPKKKNVRIIFQPQLQRYLAIDNSSVNLLVENSVFIKALPRQ